MADKRFLYFTANQVSIYGKSGTTLVIDQTLPATEEGAASFSEYVSAHSESLYYFLADIVEEDFSQESIPAVGGRDRRLVLQRKLAQRYRDTTLALTLSLGIKKDKDRREEQILFSSFTNTQQFQPWLEVIRAQSARLVGLYSVPLIAPIAGNKIGLKQGDYLLVTLEAAGLRQSYVQKGQIRFSRLGNADRSDPRVMAETCAGESGRIQQYLMNLRILPRTVTTLDAIVIVPRRYREMYEKACQSTAALKFQIMELEACLLGAGFENSPPAAEAEALFIHTLSNTQPAQQFVMDDLRRYYNLWRARIAIIVAGAAVFGFCALYAAFKGVELFTLERAASADAQQVSRAEQDYARLQATFPKTPTASDKLKVVVDNYEIIDTQIGTPEPIMIQISRALAEVPQVEIERIDWAATPMARKRAAAKSDASPKSGAAAKSGAAGADPESVQLSGLIQGEGNDYRNITRIVDRFVDALKAQKGIDVVGRRLPFDINAEKSLSGDVGAARATEVPRFTLVLSKKAQP